MEMRFHDLDYKPIKNSISKYQHLTLLNNCFWQILGATLQQGKQYSNLFLILY